MDRERVALLAAGWEPTFAGMSDTPAIGFAALSIALVAAAGLVPPSSATPAPAVCMAVAGAPTLEPIRIEMTSTGRARGASAVYEMRFAPSAFGVSVSAAGSYRYDVEVSVRGVRERAGEVYVTWVATPDLDDWVRLGPISNERGSAGVVHWNKFIVFVTAESSADVVEWSQEFLFSALSPSGKMHTMAGHGPFASEPCLDPRN